MVRAFLLVITYSVGLIAAGHGINPIGLLLIFGEPRVWGIAQLLGWIGIATLVFFTFCFRLNKHWRAMAQLLAAMLMYSSWLAFATEAAREGLFLIDTRDHMLFSAPFQLTFVSVCTLLCRDILRNDRNKGSATEIRGPTEIRRPK